MVVGCCGKETSPWLAASVEETPLQGWSGGDEEDSEAAGGGLGSVEAGPATGLWGGEKWGMEALRLLEGPVEEGKQKLREVAVWLGQPAGEEEEEK